MCLFCRVSGRVEDGLFMIYQQHIGRKHDIAGLWMALDFLVEGFLCLGKTSV